MDTNVIVQRALDLMSSKRQASRKYYEKNKDIILIKKRVKYYENRSKQ
uniref:Uncharacterized protein n=1 Tax=viral metagenome TaxID=1070528 RepID=A0A6C0DJP6_9ZZZZ